MNKDSDEYIYEKALLSVRTQPLKSALTQCLSGKSETNPDVIIKAAILDTYTTMLKKREEGENYSSEFNDLRTVIFSLDVTGKEPLWKTMEFLMFPVRLEKLLSERDCEKLVLKEYQRVKGERIFNKWRRVSGGSNHIPDGWVIRNDEYWPVEIKRETFDKRALAQLNRYIEEFSAPGGIAIADTLTVDLPPNIEFICLDVFIESRYNKTKEMTSGIE